MIARWRRRRAADRSIAEGTEKMRDALCAIHADGPRLRQAVDDLIAAIDNHQDSPRDPHRSARHRPAS